MSKLLDNFLQNQYCNNCGEKLTNAKVEILAQSENHILAQIDCPHCGAEHIATITSQSSENKENMNKQENRNLLDGNPITTDEVLDAHKFLQNFDGNYSNLFGVENKQEKKGKQPKSKKSSRFLFRT